MKTDSESCRRFRADALRFTERLRERHRLIADPVGTRPDAVTLRGGSVRVRFYVGDVRDRFVETGIFVADPDSPGGAREIDAGSYAQYLGVYRDYYFRTEDPSPTDPAAAGGGGPVVRVRRHGVAVAGGRDFFVRAVRPAARRRPGGHAGGGDALPPPAVGISPDGPRRRRRDLRRRPTRTAAPPAPAAGRAAPGGVRADD